LKCHECNRSIPAYRVVHRRPELKPKGRAPHDEQNCGRCRNRGINCVTGQNIDDEDSYDNEESDNGYDEN